MLTFILFPDLYLLASGFLTGKPKRMCAPPAGLIPVGTTTITPPSEGSLEALSSLFFKIATFRTSKPGKLPTSSLWYNSSQHENQHYLVHIGYMIVDYVRSSARATAMDRDRCLQRMEISSCAETEGVELYPLPGFSYRSNCWEHRDRLNCSDDSCYISVYGCEPLDSSLIQVIQGGKEEQFWKEMCRFRCFENESCKAWAAGISYSINPQRHWISKEEGSFRWRCWMFASVHSEPIPLSGNIAEGTMFYAGSKICRCSDLPTKDHCNVFWTHCEYGVAQIDISGIGSSCFTVIKEPSVLACKELPMLSVPLSETWGVVRDVQFLRKREKIWKFPTYNYTYFVEFRDVYGAEPFFLRFYLKPYQTREKCTRTNIDTTTNYPKLVAEIYVMRLGKKVVFHGEEFKGYFGFHISNSTECSNYCRSCWHSIYLLNDSISAGDTIVVEFIYVKPAMRFDKIPYYGDGGMFWVNVEWGMYVDKVMIDYNMAGESLTPYANCDKNCTALRVLKPLYTPVQGSRTRKFDDINWMVKVPRPGMGGKNSSSSEHGTITASMREIFVSSDSKHSLLQVKVKHLTLV